MRLEPVYLVAPKPSPKAMPTRRALFGMGLAFVVGGAVGTACGYSVGKSSASAADASGRSDDPNDLPSTGDAVLDELRRLAVKAPIEDLMRTAMRFTTTVEQEYLEDEIVWRGVARIAEYVVAHEDVRDRRMLATWVAQVIEGAPPERRAFHIQWVPQLRAIK